MNVVTSSRAHTAEVGQVLCQSQKVAGISFTGSTNVNFLHWLPIDFLEFFFKDMNLSVF